MSKLKTVMEDCLEVPMVSDNGTGLIIRLSKTPGYTSGYKLWIPKALTSKTIMIYHVHMDSYLSNFSILLCDSDKMYHYLQI